MEAVTAKAATTRVPGHYDKVYKDECMFCFANAESEGGLYINLTNFQATCKDHLRLDQARSGGALYLHQQSRRVPLTANQEEAQQAAPDKLAIGMLGGFDVAAKKYNVETEYAVVTGATGEAFPLPCPDLPEQVLASVTAIQMHDSANTQNQVEAWQEERHVSKYADGLEQLPCTRTIPMDPAQWKCDDTGVTENLWLNLSTGHIGSGRAHWDGTGGNNSALRHFEQTGKKYPLAVKLGTITPSGADVYSYAAEEDDMVLDPLLAQHLAHWGINMLQMEKTEKTMAELQIEKNMAYEFDKITEAGSALHPLSGPGYTGLQNLGNSCYMNSVLQVLWAMPEIQQRYVQRTEDIYQSAPQDVASDFLSQFAKVGVALVGGKTARTPAAPGAPHFDAVTVVTGGGLEAIAEDNLGDFHSVSPQTFKNMIGKGHQEFSSMRQQDAQEFFNYLLDAMTRAERAGSGRLPDADKPTSKLFEFGVETRVQCLESQRVSYRQEGTTLLSLEIPLEAATNKEALEQYNERQQKRQKLKSDNGGSAIKVTEPEERVIPKVPLSACIEKFAADEVIDGYFSAYLNKTTQACKRVRCSSFPSYLMVQLRRYYIDTNWTPKKLEVLVDVPEHLSLEMMRGTGLQDGEELQPEVAEAGTAAVASVVPDEAIVAQLVTMGFPDIGSRKAAAATGNTSAEAAMEWVLAHMEDPNFNAPEGASTVETAVVDADSVAMLTGMGFTARQAEAALAACNGSVERAADWLFSRMDDLDTAVDSELAKADPGTQQEALKKLDFDDGKAEYELIGFISHMGSNTACGHYVCHVKKDGRWAIFNDEKVATSEHPPLELGYMYLYKRANN